MTELKQRADLERRVQESCDVMGSRTISLGIAVIGVVMWAVALFYQYVLDAAPCVLCIQVRLWLTAVIVLAVVAAALDNRRWARLPVWLLMLGASIGLAERAWQVLGTEKGWTLGSCSFSTGLPDWFAMDQWFPALFQPLEPCGYTPELIGGVTMGEGLMVVSVLLVLAIVTGGVLALKSALKRRAL